MPAEHRARFFPPVLPAGAQRDHANQVSPTRPTPARTPRILCQVQAWFLVFSLAQSLFESDDFRADVRLYPAGSHPALKCLVRFECAAIVPCVLMTVPMVSPGRSGLVGGGKDSSKLPHRSLKQPRTGRSG